MELQLAEQVVAVFGGAGDIGRAIAEAFAQEKAAVALIDVNPSASKIAAEIAEQHRVPAFGLVADAVDYAAVRETVTNIRDSLGRCDHVVYAAAVGSGKYGFPFWNLEPDDWRRVVEVDLLGAVNVAHAFAPVLSSQRSGTILFLSSVAGQIGSQTDPPYSAAKAAMINFAQCAAKDLAPYEVRVNTICPGMIKTRLNRSVWQAWHDQQPENARLSYEKWAEQKIASLTPLGRWQEPRDIGALAAFLASDQAKNITGQTLNVDGGWVMH